MTRKTSFFDGWSWFKFNNLGLALGTNLKFYASVTKGLKLKVRKFWGLIPTFVEVTGEKLVGKGLFAPPILNRVKIFFITSTQIVTLSLICPVSYQIYDVQTKTDEVRKRNHDNIKHFLISQVTNIKSILRTQSGSRDIAYCLPIHSRPENERSNTL